MKMLKKQSGFTIVELLIVIVVIAILATIAIVAYTGIQNNARIANLQADLQGTYKKLANDVTLTGGFPATLATADSGKGITASTGNTYNYVLNTSVSPSTYCLSETNTSSGISYVITNVNNIPQPGTCTSVTNIVTNPSFETGVANWGTANGASIASSTLYPASGSYSAAVTTSSTLDSGINPVSPTLTAGLSYTASGTITATTAGNYALSPQGVAGTASRTTIALAAGQTQRFSIKWIPSTTGLATLYFLRSGGQSGTTTFYVDGVMLIQSSTLYPYADGSSPNWTWTGTANASTSTGPPL